MELAGLGPQSIKRMFQRGAPRPPPKRQRGGAVVRQHDQLPALVAADMLGHHLALVQHADLVTVGANDDRPAHPLRRCRIAIAVELDPRMGSDDGRYDLIGIERDRRQGTKQRAFALEAIDRPLPGRLVDPHVGHLVAPQGAKAR